MNVIKNGFQCVNMSFGVLGYFVCAKIRINKVSKLVSLVVVVVIVVVNYKETNTRINCTQI